MLIATDAPQLVLFRSMLRNSFNAEAATAIVDAVKDKPQLLTLCGIKPEETKRDFSNQFLDVGDAMLLAFDLRNNSTLVALKCAPSRLQSAFERNQVSVATDSSVLGFVHSLAKNNLTNYGSDMSGVIQLAEALKNNSGLRELKFVPLDR